MNKEQKMAIAIAHKEAEKLVDGNPEIADEYQYMSQSQLAGKHLSHLLISDNTKRLVVAHALKKLLDKRKREKIATARRRNSAGLVGSENKAKGRGIFKNIKSYDKVMITPFGRLSEMDYAIILRNRRNSWSRVAELLNEIYDNNRDATRVRTMAPYWRSKGFVVLSRLPRKGK